MRRMSFSSLMGSGICGFGLMWRVVILGEVRVTALLFLEGIFAKETAHFITLRLSWMTVEFEKPTS
jgi:hypothetical protein